MTPDDAIKVFHLNRSMFNADLDRLEERYGVTLRPPTAGPSQIEKTYFAQFPAQLRAAASAMAQHYEIFYCLENYIRDLVVDQLLAAHGSDWWNKVEPRVVVPQIVKDNVERNRQRERDAGVTPRSPDLIDYTTFGELSNIIEANWEDFGDMFNSKRGLVAVLSRLNVLRGPIAHCSELSEDEVLRLELSLSDWFRLMS